MLCSIELQKPLETGSPGRRRTGMISFTRGVHFYLCHRGIENWYPMEELHPTALPPCFDANGLEHR